LETAHTVTHLVRPKIGKNELGQTVYGLPVATDRDVFGWYQLSTAEGVARRTGQAAALGHRIITYKALLTPDGDWAPDSQVILEGETYDVDGDVEDFNRGPFGYRPGYRVTLKRVADGPT
jgi:hypothetical protein